jgi:hypothetical protein
MVIEPLIYISAMERIDTPKKYSWTRQVEAIVEKDNKTKPIPKVQKRGLTIIGKLWRDDDNQLSMSTERHKDYDRQWISDKINPFAWWADDEQSYHKELIMKILNGAYRVMTELLKVKLMKEGTKNPKPWPREVLLYGKERKEVMPEAVRAVMQKMGFTRSASVHQSYLWWNYFWHLWDKQIKKARNPRKEQKTAVTHSFRQSDVPTDIARLVASYL